MIDQFINFVIRPPRAEYNPEENLWEKEFSIGGREFIRQDLEIINKRGHSLKCTHYMPFCRQQEAEEILPCVIYCHGNSGCRADANDAALILLPSNITLFTLDFSGSGLSDGNYVSLGAHESHDDLNVVVSYLRTNQRISRIALWGRSMGAVTSLLYASQDPSIAGMVLDSPFSNLFNLMLELVHLYNIRRLPKFTVKVALQYMRRVIQKKAKFDIMGINPLKVAPKTFIPALFGHAKGDKFIQPHHSDLIFNSYAGDKNMIKFDGDHNSSRPQFYYDSVSIFFYNVLHPPRVSPSCSSKYEKYYDLGDLQVDAGLEEKYLVNDLSMGSLHEPSLFQDKPSVQTEECCSSTSSNRGSWGRCSSLGSVGELNDDLVTFKVLATPLRTTQHEPTDLFKEKKKVPMATKRSGREKFERLEALSQRLRLCILGRVSHRRNHSS
uniref:uncharacterized protein LOC122584191 n=1 Tax=Erigeron canadensis TaxID=72917 RepID=UPI001CB941E8|nr:uncharacterized protein LOC122584191 [Erigeron canadensis]